MHPRNRLPRKRSSRLRLTGALSAMLLLGGADVALAAALEETKPNRISNELVMQIRVRLGPDEDMGRGPDGHRINYPIVGGTFVGKGVKGRVVPGGADMSVERDDGVTMIHALYRLKTDDGQIIIIDNAGIWRPNETGLVKQAKGLELAQNDYYARTTPQFKTQPGRHAWLNDYIFVGTIDDVSEDEVLIEVYKVDGL
ncbi:DUF3237 domain-containing protein [Pseudomonas sp. CAU 1711]|uniref:DUF3237 domain-containing protein n=1 Tax=Pseudomonas sp. CAU 1711 TaxID=3140356 RepID=UPI0032607291